MLKLQECFFHLSSIDDLINLYQYNKVAYFKLEKFRFTVNQHTTIGFEELAELTGKSSKSLMRMLGPNGNLRANNLFSIIGMLQEKDGVMG